MSLPFFIKYSFFFCGEGVCAIPSKTQVFLWLCALGSLLAVLGKLCGNGDQMGVGHVQGKPLNPCTVFPAPIIYSVKEQIFNFENGMYVILNQPEL